MNEVCYNKFLSLGIPKAWAKIMATQPDEAGLSGEDCYNSRLGVVLGFAYWDETNEGLDFWYKVRCNVNRAFSMSPEDFMKDVSQ